MTEQKRLESYVSVRARFQRSVKLESDFLRPDALDGYVISRLGRDSALRIGGSLSTPNGGRAYSIIGPYGSGKSSFATFVCSILADPAADSEPMQRFAQRWPDEAQALLGHLSALSGPLVPILVTGQRAPIGLTILRGLKVAASAVFANTSVQPPVLLDIERDLSNLADGGQVDDASIVARLTDFADAVVEHGCASGVILVIDEMGKLLEWAAQSPAGGDVYIFQLLAEQAARHQGAVIGIVSILHQAFDAYADGLPRSARIEWAKVSGRYEQIPYLESPAHLLELVVGALAVDESAHALPLHQVFIRDTDKLLKLYRHADEHMADHLHKAFPLHPVTALSLGPFCRQRMAQNERSLFSFLASHEPCGFQAYLNRVTGAKKDGLFCVDHLYDYVVENASIRHVADARDRVWGASEQALSRLPNDADPLDARVVKAVTILSVVAHDVGLVPNLKCIALALGFPTRKQVKASLERLSAASIVVFRQFKQAYQVWDGSDLDVGEIVERSRRKVRAEGGLAHRLQAQFSPDAVVASRHYYQTGTMRFMVPRFMDRPDWTTAELGPALGDGYLFYIVPDRPDDLADTVSVLGRPSLFEQASGVLPAIYVVPTSVEALIEATINYFAVVDAVAGTPELDGDPVARRELEQLQVIGHEQLSQALDGAFGRSSHDTKVQWFYRSEVVSVGGRPSAVVSRVFDDVYAKAPIIKNELANRGKLSSAAAAARRTLLERLVLHVDAPNLGIEGHPPELSMYRSILEVTGLHGLADGQYGLRAPIEGDALYPLFSALDRHLTHEAGKRVGFADLSELLSKPPFGLRPGVSLILLFAYILVRDDRLFIYEDGSFMPNIGDDFVQRFIKRPKTVDVQWVNLAQAERVVEAVAETVFSVPKGRSPGLMKVVRGLVQQIRKLSVYASMTQRVSETARRVRSAIKAARDPMRLIVRDLPRIVLSDRDGQISTDADVQAFSTQLADALREVIYADRSLLNEVESFLMSQLAPGQQADGFYPELAARAARLDGMRGLSPRLNRMVEMTSGLDFERSADRQAFLENMAIAVSGKALAQWSDADVEKFRFGAVDVCQSFMAAEKLLLELGGTADDGVALFRVSVLDSAGCDHSTVAIVREDEEEAFERFVTQVEALADQEGLRESHFIAAALAKLLSNRDT